MTWRRLSNEIKKTEMELRFFSNILSMQNYLNESDYYWSVEICTLTVDREKSSQTTYGYKKWILCIMTAGRRRKLKIQFFAGVKSQQIFFFLNNVKIGLLMFVFHFLEIIDLFEEHRYKPYFERIIWFKFTFVCVSQFT